MLPCAASKVYVKSEGTDFPLKLLSYWLLLARAASSQAHTSGLFTVLVRDGAWPSDLPRNNLLFMNLASVGQLRSCREERWVEPSCGLFLHASLSLLARWLPLPCHFRGVPGSTLSSNLPPAHTPNLRGLLCGILFLSLHHVI